MALNKYFNYSSNKKSDSCLHQKLLDESIQISGNEIKYIRRNLVDIDNILNEHNEATFGKAKPIEIYIDNFEGFGADDLVSKFGLTLDDQLRFSVSTARFDEEIGGVPLEGDLIYFELTDTILEIKYVDNEADFYSLGRNRKHKLTAEIFDYSGEELNTGIDEIDDFDEINFNVESGEKIELFDEEDEGIIDFSVDNPLGTYGSENV